MTEDKEWGICPHCDARIKYRNMRSHLKKVHKTYDQSTAKQRVVSRNKARKTWKSGKKTIKAEYEAIELRKSIQEKEQRGKKILGIGLIVVIILMSSTLYWLFLFQDNSNGNGDGDEDVVESDTDPNIGQMAYSFESKDIDGNEFDLGGFLGSSPILIEFFSSSCGKCISLSPVLGDIQDEYGDDIIMISVSVSTKDSLESIIEFKKEDDSNWLFIAPTISEKEEIRGNYTIRGFPTLTFIDKDGIIVDTIFSKSIEEETDTDFELIADAVGSILDDIDVPPDEPPDEPPITDVGTSIGDVPPQINLSDTQGGNFNLHSQLGGRPIMIEFFYTKCGYCNDLAAVLNDIYDEYGNRVTMASVATSSKDDINTVRDYQTRHESVWYHLSGDKSAMYDIQRAYDHGTYPSIVIVGSNGEIFDWIRADDLHDYDMEFNYALMAETLNDALAPVA